ncbi:MAG: hypothetical protein H8E56_01950 [Candidatus Marinimicrobia bacterium]|nr:hypothetical protein [Candidatus Neomarinimicrobiota bacterium]
MKKNKKLSTEKLDCWNGGLLDWCFFHRFANPFIQQSNFPIDNSRLLPKNEGGQG